MEFYFENITVYSMRLMLQARYYLAAKRMTIWLLVYILLGIWIANPDADGSVNYLSLMICIGFTCYLLLQPYFMTRKAIKREMQFYNGTIPPVNFRFGDQIMIWSHDASRTVEYYQIAKVRSLKNVYLLCLSDKSALLLDKAGFTCGTFADFKQFLRTKRPDLKIPE